ncbi:MAG: WYL domain-containing protein [Clostridia bacterium]|nr:WYL domain-containing protein [Clostridia bacterium]
MFCEVIILNLNNTKTFRLLNLYERLNRGETVNKKEFANEFEISEKSVQRDIDDLRVYLAECYENGDDITVEYSYVKNGYYLVKKDKEFLTNEEILGISKILIESRAYNKDELEGLIDKLLHQATPSARMNIKEMILNEKFHYVPLKHNKPLLNAIWELSECIHNKNIITFDYERQDHKITHRTVKPLAIMFSEYYFYLIAWFADDSKDYPAVFRVDRITNVKCHEEKFNIPYSERFEEGEFRKRVQFMYSGPLKSIRFEFSGPSLEAILDRIPTAEIVAQNGNKTTIKAECYGDGVLMWLRTQGDNVKIL